MLRDGYQPQEVDRDTRICNECRLLAGQRLTSHRALSGHMIYFTAHNSLQGMFYNNLILQMGRWFRGAWLVQVTELINGRDKTKT